MPQKPQSHDQESYASWKTNMIDSESSYLKKSVSNIWRWYFENKLVYSVNKCTSLMKEV